MDQFAELRTLLKNKRAELDERVHRIKDHARHISDPLEQDSKERAVQLENDEVEDALEKEAQIELQAIDRALARIASGRYGRCQDCGNPIAIERLRALPYTDRCIDCAR